MPTETSDDTKHLWFNICYELGKIMTESMKIAKDSFIFYWVDGIYVKDKPTAMKIKKFFEDNEFPSKLRKMRKTRIDEKHNRLYVYDVYGGEPRYFPIGDL